MAEQTGLWRPLHENHAIELMAAVVTFAQPIPDLLLKKALSVSEDIASSAGLKSRHHAKGLHFVVSIDGVSPTESPDGVRGIIFSAPNEPTITDKVATKVGEQLRLDQSAIIYRSSKYLPWAEQFERLRSLINPTLDCLKDAVQFATVRFEYLNRFWFDGEIADAAKAHLLRAGCPLLPAYIYTVPDLWHCHTGAFVTEMPVKRLQQIMLDALDGVLPERESSEPVRYVNITIAYEDRFDFEETKNVEINKIFETLDLMHSSIKTLLASLISPELSDKLRLEEK